MYDINQYGNDTIICYWWVFVGLCGCFDVKVFYIEFLMFL